MIGLMQGSLKLGRTRAQGLYAYDGVNFYKVQSPYLIQKFFKHRGKIIIWLAGSWIVVGNWVVAFKRDKKIVHQHINLYERYSRKDIKRRAE
ncbi:MAG: hypothetical protein WC476_12080 [Phycisphaerae bacterium]